MSCEKARNVGKRQSVLITKEMLLFVLFTVCVVGRGVNAFYTPVLGDNFIVDYNATAYQRNYSISDNLRSKTNK